MAQALLTALLSGRTAAEVTSAGLLPGGAPLPSETSDALAALGLPGVLSGFVSTQVTKADVAYADLVLGMSREHVREVIVGVPEAWERTFTLKELVRRGTQAGPRRLDEGLSTWLGRAANGRTRGDLLGSSTADDIEDPIGGRPLDFERTAREIDGLCRTLVALVWPMN